MSMSLRLSDEAITSHVNPVTGKIAVHPRSGEPIVPIGRRANGVPIFPILGGSGEEDDANDDGDAGGEDDDDAESDDDKDDPEGSDKSGKGSEGDDDRDPQKKIVALEDEKNRHLRRRREAERERDELQRQIEEAKNKDKPEVERLQTENENLKSENETLSTALQEARLQNAFLQDNTYEWHNPGRALKLADLSEVEFDDDGKVHGLKAALDALVKTDPYLVKAKDDKDEKDPPKKTGTPPKGKSKKDDPKDRSAMATKYPGLRR